VRQPTPNGTAGTVLHVDDRPPTHLELREASGPQISAADLYAVLCLRSDVFVVEQRCAYLDPDGRDLDPDTTHLWFEAPGATVASYLRIIAEPGGGHRIGRVVTAPDQRGRRLAARLLQHALALLDGPVVLHAQSHLVGMYERHGFAVDGPEYLDDGILHTPMRLT
jgi:ElaA protein